jgi:hypothetical protein
MHMSVQYGDELCIICFVHTDTQTSVVLSAHVQFNRINTKVIQINSLFIQYIGSIVSHQ